MKDLPLEEKAQFFALYWGQEVFSYLETKKPRMLEGSFLEMVKHGQFDDAFLQLRSIDSLSDEELVKCYHLHSAAIAYDYTQDFKDVLTMAKHWIEKDGIKTLFKYTCTSDYLRSRSIAIPFFSPSENRLITIEQLQSLGWLEVK